MQPLGGISRYFTNLAIELDRLGQEPRIFAGLYQNIYLSNIQNSINNGFFVNSYPKKTGWLFNFGNHCFTQNQIIDFNSDIIHETYFTKYRPWKSKAARVITVYDMIHELFPESFKIDDNLSKLKKRALLNADHIISISQNTKNDLVELFNIPEDKISVVHLASNISKLHKFKSLKVTPKPFILYVGSRAEYKNFNLLLFAYSKSKRVQNDFNLVAFGGGLFSERERKTILDLNLSPENVLQKSGTDHDLHNFYSSASVFVYPSKYEGFGLPPLEAMTFGCPVISSNTSSMPEVIGDAALYFSPSQPDELLEVLEKVLYSDHIKNQLVDKGGIRIQNFSWSKCAHETLDIYQKLI